MIAGEKIKSVSLIRAILLLPGLLLNNHTEAGNIAFYGNQINLPKVYYVSETGNDTTGNGGFDTPFRTIKSALSLSGRGDTIILKRGIYREVNIITSDGICIMADPGSEPVISGLDTIKNWTVYEGHIYKASISMKVSQLFTSHNGELEQMVYARFPNLESPDLFDQKYAIANSVDYNSLSPSTLNDDDLSRLTGIDITGASLWLPYPFDTRWNSNTEIVTSQTSSTLGFTASENDANLRKDKNYNVWYHLTGKLSLLDAEKEWYYDIEGGVLYFYAPDGLNPNDLTILARTRDVSLTISNHDEISVKGISFLATGLKANGNKLTVRECNFYYPTPFFDTERWIEQAFFSVSGDSNLIEKCEVAYSWGTGISMRNSTNSAVRNCLVHDCNWSGSISPGIWISGTSMTASQNTIYNLGRSGIRLYHIYNGLLEKNHIYNYGLINKDLGSIKGGLQDYKHTVWRYNFSHDFNDSEDAAKAGIYLDASNDNATVHHNVHYGVHLSVNGNVNNDSIINNTFVRYSEKKIWSHYIRPGNDWDYRSVYTYNNLATNTIKGTILQNNLIADVDSMKFAGAEYGDFRILGNSPAIDRAMHVSDINDNYTGTLPDIGAYEYGDTSINGTWMAGITWSPDWNSLPSAQITISRDSLYPSSCVFSVKDEIDKDGWIMRYDWEFGDGKKAYGKTVSHLYKQNGIKEVTLSLRDNLAGRTTIRSSMNIDLTPVKFQVYLKSEDSIYTSGGNRIIFEGELELITGSAGRDSVLLAPGTYNYTIIQPGYNNITDTLIVSGEEELYIVDTLIASVYEVKIMIKDQDSGEPVSGSRIELNGIKQVTDESGKALFSELGYSEYSLSIIAEGYQLENFSNIEILSDTVMTFYLLREYPQVNLNIVDQSTGNPVYRASVLYAGKSGISDHTGNISLQKVDTGFLHFSIEHPDYFLFIDTVNIFGDTSLVISLTSRTADLGFHIIDSNGPLEQAEVIINNRSLLTNSSGNAWFIGLHARKVYSFTVEKPGYSLLEDSLWMEVDTILNITLEKSLSNNMKGNIQAVIYPNPASGKIFIRISVNEAECILMNAIGSVKIGRKLYPGLSTLDVSHLPEGLYILNIYSAKKKQSERVIIR